MGSIQHINSPKKWEIIREGNSKIMPNDYIYQMKIGECEDVLSCSDIVELISKENYDKILNGTYKIKAFPYNTQTIIIFDKNNNIIPLIIGKQDEGYETNQKNYIKKLTKTK